MAAPSPPPKEQPSRWWVWDVAGKLILLLVAGVAIALVWKNPGDWLGKMKTAAYDGIALGRGNQYVV